MHGKHQSWQFLGLSLVLVWLFSSVAVAGILTGELDKVDGTVDDTFVYTLSIEGSYRQEPGFPDIDGLIVRKGGTSSSFQSFNGVTTRRLQVIFYLNPQRVGSFEIPSIVMVIDGQQQSTLPLTITVHESNSNITPSGRDEQPFFVERLVSKNELYAGEPIVITDLVYTRVRLMEADLKRDNFPADFRQLENSDERRYQKHHEGQVYTVIELQTLLVPMKAGEFKVPALVLSAGFPDPNQSQRRPSMFDDLMGRTPLIKRATRSAEQTVVVNSLPAEGRSSQYSGLVGRFQMDTKVGQRSVESGDNINLTIRVFGEGLSEGMSEPNANFASSLRVYSEKPISNDQIQGQKLIGERVFQYTLVPSQTGIIELGSVAIQFFNPQTGTYEWLREELGSVEVRPRAGQEAPSLSQSSSQSPSLAVDRRAVTILEQDIAGLRNLSSVKTQHVMTGLDWLAVSGMGAGGLAFALIGWVRRFMNDTADVRKQRLKQSRAARHFYQSIESASKSKEPSEFATQMNRSFREYLRDKSQDDRFLSASQRELHQFFEGKQVSQVTLSNMEKLLKECDRLIYAPSIEKAVSYDSIVASYRHLIEELEKAWRGVV